MKKQEITLPVPVAKESALSTWLKKINPKVCQLKKNVHLCSAFHIEQASRLANYLLRAFFMPSAKDIVPTPVWSVNAPTACSRWNATGKRYFFCTLLVSHQYIVSF